MNNALKKYLSEALTFMSDKAISEGTKVDKDAAAVVIATEGDEFKGKKGTIKLGTKGLPKKPVIKEEGEEDADADKLEEEEEGEEDIVPIDEEETEEDESCNEDEDDGAEDGEICEEDESCNEDEDDGAEDGEGEEDGDEMVDDDQIEDPKKKKLDIKESYIAEANKFMYDDDNYIVETKVWDDDDDDKSN